VSIALPFLNSGGATAHDVKLTSFALGSAVRIEPVFPLLLGDVGRDNATAAKAIFSSAGLVVGGRYLITVRGTYDFNGSILGFTLNRYVAIPTAARSPISFLAASVTATVNQAADTWSYTVANKEAVESPRFVNAVSIDMQASFVVTGTPPGWIADTDNFSYVLWYVPSSGAPSSRHIAPGKSLGGFQIHSHAAASQGESYTVTSVNVQTGDGDRVAFGTTLGPGAA